MIEFRQVRRTFGSKVAVAGLDLVIPSGELFAFLGPNGAGKTTSIKMLVGLLRPSAGEVRLCGHNVATHSREANRSLGYVPDEPYLYDKLTGREFLQFIVDMYGVEPRLAAERIEREIARFDLGGFVDDLTESYSHGMKQRTVFASVLLHDPAVLVLDEPMVGLDPKSARNVKDMLRDLAAGGTTVLMSTHTLSIAEEIADRIGIITAGRLRFLGTVAELRQMMSEEEGSLEQLFLDLTADVPDVAGGKLEAAADGDHGRKAAPRAQRDGSQAAS